ncbi:hypothetical protein Taro_041447 [Colocasia esculenta]|uniref:Protein kinase domain-containing protein n=1 Tax=Colocasia esculenta TaxID=4460 RepID=A0A843WPW4_COLES|nr:hypothetical protein [Colocasia esculenta]
MGAVREGYYPPAKSLQALVCFALVLLLLPLTSSQSYDIYQVCSPVQLSCGKGTIDSVVAPFRTDEQPKPCGRRSHRLFCHGEYPAIQINSVIYWVKEINYQTMLITLVNLDLVGTFCSSEIANLDISPFLFNSDVKTVTINYNCSCQMAVDKYFWVLPCPANSSTSYAYLSVTEPPFRGCNCYGVQVNIAFRRPELEVLLSKRGSVDPERFMELLLHGFRLWWSPAYREIGWCEACKASGGECAYYGMPAGQICSCQGRTYSPMCPPPGAAGWTSRMKVIIGTSLGIGGFLVLCLPFLCLYFLHCKMFYTSHVKTTRKKLKQSIYIDAFLRIYGSLAPKRYSYSDLEKVTNSFSKAIGKGGFATVFEGKLPDGRSVAVKVLANNAKCNGRVFVNEVVSIACTYHVNIVSLLGYCLEGRVRALIYEFMPNGSLERYIFGDKRGTLGWEKLYNIAVGIARGLEYLHRGCQMSILHFDIKPHNILLDHEFCPKISDFGLAKLCRIEENDVLTSNAGGTIGYIAPEVVDPGFGSVSNKSDVYSYGMMVLEMVGGRKNFEPLVEHSSEIYYPHWVYKHMNQDGKFQVCGALTEDEAVTARRMIMVGLWCIQRDPAERPSITQVVAMLEGKLEESHMPSMPLLYNLLEQQRCPRPRCDKLETIF